jgi:hypothetical protein
LLGDRCYGNLAAAIKSAGSGDTVFVGGTKTVSSPIQFGNRAITYVRNTLSSPFLFGHRAITCVQNMHSADLDSVWVLLPLMGATFRSFFTFLGVIGH